MPRGTKPEGSPGKAFLQLFLCSKEATGQTNDMALRIHHISDNNIRSHYLSHTGSESNISQRRQGKMHARLHQDTRREQRHLGSDFAFPPSNVFHFRSSRNIQQEYPAIVCTFSTSGPSQYVNGEKSHL